MASLQLLSQLLNERKKCALPPSKPQLLALLGFPLSNVLPKGPGAGGWLLVALGDPVAAAGLWVTAQHPALGIHHHSFPRAAHPVQLVGNPWSVTVTSSAPHQPDVTAHDPALLGTGSAGGPPTQELYQPRGWRAQVSPPWPGRPPMSLFSRHKISPRWKFHSRFPASGVISTGAGGRASPEPPGKVRSTMGDLKQGPPPAAPSHSVASTDRATSTGKLCLK